MLKIYKDAIEAIVETLESDYSMHYYDLHYAVFNTDYYTVYHNDGIRVCDDYGTWDAIERVSKWERENFGEVNINDITDPCNLANMLWYIIGDEVLCNMISNIKILYNNWNNVADEEINAAIIAEMKELFAEV